MNFDKRLFMNINEDDSIRIMRVSTIKNVSIDTKLISYD